MKIRKSYVICACPRSGSTLLADGLRGTRVAGNPEEWFAPLATPDNTWLRNVRDIDEFRRHQLAFHSAPTDSEYIERISRFGCTPNGVFGLKLHVGQIGHAKQRLRGHLRDGHSPFDVLLRNTFPDLSFIWIRRRDKVAQAISLYRAIRSGEFKRIRGAPRRANGSAAELALDLNEVYRYAEILTGEDAAWEALFTRFRLDPLVVYYEDFALSYAATIERALRFIDVDAALPNPLEPNLERQADAMSDEWRAAFLSRYQAAPTVAPELLGAWVEALVA